MDTRHVRHSPGCGEQGGLVQSTVRAAQVHPFSSIRNSSPISVQMHANKGLHPSATNPACQLYKHKFPGSQVSHEPLC